MKICVITGRYKPYVVGGAEIYVEKLVHALSKRHEVVLITTSPDYAWEPVMEVEGNVRIYRFRPFMAIYDKLSVETFRKILKAVAASVIDIWNPHSFKVVKELLSHENPDIVHTHSLEHISASVFSATRAARVPCMHTCHSYSMMSVWPGLFNYRKGEIVTNFNFLEWQYMKIKRHLARSIDVVTAPSQFTLDVYKQHGFFLNAKCVNLPVPLDLANRRKSAKEYQTIDIMYVGQLIRPKGVHILINSFRQLPQSNIRLHIVGEGGYADQLWQLAEGDTRITFHGFVPHQEIAKFYDMANVIVVPSIWYENSPGVIYEAFSHGTPALATKIGGIPELINESNGFLFEAGNEIELRDIIENLVENPSKLRRLEETAFQSAIKYDIKQHITELEKLYESCLMQ